MTDVILLLENDTDSVNLNALLEGTDEGMQVLAGLTGLGLPPVDVQWQEGAGDGARARGKRVLPRTIDLPLYLAAGDRAGLKALTSALSLIVADRVTLRLIEPDGTEWTVNGFRIGGGDYAYGEDTDGTIDLLLTVSIMTESPYWERVDEESTLLDDADIGDIGAPTDLAVVNDGTVKSYPTWEIDGPGIDLKITSPSGELLHFSDYIEKGSTITVDAEQGTVVDETGANRYGGLAAAPKFFAIPPGESDVTVELDRSSTRFIDAQAAGRFNYVTNPRLEANASGWTLVDGASYDGTNKRITIHAKTKTSTYPAAVAQPFYETAEVSATGLTPGQTYMAKIDVAWTGAAPGFPGQVLVTIFDGATAVNGYGLAYTTSMTTLTFIFVATTDTASIKVEPANKRAYTAGRLTSVQSCGAIVDKAFIGEPGDYFDGSTTDTADFLYSWEGSADASRSKAISTAVDASGAQVRCHYKPRNWMVV